MPIAIVFAAGDLDYIDKLNSLITSINAMEAGGTFETFAATGGTSAAAPAYARSSDLNTGLFFPGADILAGGTGGAERWRTTLLGYFKASPAGAAGYLDAVGSYHEFHSGATGAVALVRSTASGPDGLNITFSAASPDDNTQWFLSCSDATTVRLRVYSDGDIFNHDGTYGTISDARLKAETAPANSQWEDMKLMPFIKFRSVSDVEQYGDLAPWRLGNVAQEIEAAGMPGLVVEGLDGLMMTKMVKDSVLVKKAVVALQEAQRRIERIETHLGLPEFVF